MYWNDLERHAGGSCMEEIWQAHPAVREAINARISGDPAVWPLDWFRGAFADRLPLARALSIGCGAGALERDLVAKGICERITGIDVAGPPLEKARQDAAAAGWSDRITYELAEAREVLKARTGTLDAVFFHASLHHFDRLDDLLQLVAGALAPGGLLYVDEYVGPSRRQWHPLRMLPANLAYYALPSSVRRPRLIRAPVNDEDPTEAVASHEIVPAIARHLDVLARRDYGGNLLSLVYPNLRRPDAASSPRQRADFERAVARLLSWEERLLGRARSYFTVTVAGRRQPSYMTAPALSS
jgi:SAM-dependent methyltransferase